MIKVKVDYHGEKIVKIPPFLESTSRFSFKNTPFLLKSMDHASNRKAPSFSMQKRTSVCSTFELDCRGTAVAGMYSPWILGIPLKKNHVSMYTALGQKKKVNGPEVQNIFPLSRGVNSFWHHCIVAKRIVSLL